MNDQENKRFAELKGYKETRVLTPEEQKEFDALTAKNKNQ
jgi:hypothetical protein